VKGLRRRLVDLQPGRTWLALLVAPIPAAVITLVCASILRQLSLQEILQWARAVFGTSLGWSVIAAVAYLVAVAPWRREIGRRECLIAGGLAGATFPAGVIALRHLGPSALLDTLELPRRHTPLPVGILDWSDPTTPFIVAPALAFGLLGGWIFWGVAVRSIPLSPADGGGAR
jgi:hypothetical protein